jgi:hypothetical protein
MIARNAREPLANDAAFGRLLNPMARPHSRFGKSEDRL